MEPNLCRGHAKQGSRGIQLLRHLLVRLRMALKVSSIKRLVVLGLLIVPIGLLVLIGILGTWIARRLLLILLLPSWVGHLDLQAHVRRANSGCCFRGLMQLYPGNDLMTQVVNDRGSVLGSGALAS